MEHNEGEQKYEPSLAPLSQEQREEALDSLYTKLLLLNSALFADIGGVSVELIHAIAEGAGAFDVGISTGLGLLGIGLSAGTQIVRSKIKRLSSESK